MAQTLYRFRDADGTLLYVGITMNMPTRFAKHRGDKDWWSEVASITMQSYPDRPAVLEAERQAIQTEKPRYNIQHSVFGAVVQETPARPGPHREASQVRDCRHGWVEGDEFGNIVCCDCGAMPYSANPALRVARALR